MRAARFILTLAAAMLLSGCAETDVTIEIRNELEVSVAAAECLAKSCPESLEAARKQRVASPAIPSGGIETLGTMSGGSVLVIVYETEAGKPIGCHVERNLESGETIAVSSSHLDPCDFDSANQ